MATNQVFMGNEALIDITDTTATESTVASGEVFYKANGEQAIGEMENGGSTPSTAVLYTEQTLEDEQKAQARANIETPRFFHYGEEIVDEELATTTTTEISAFVNDDFDGDVDSVESGLFSKASLKTDYITGWELKSSAVVANETALMATFAETVDNFDDTAATGYQKIIALSCEGFTEVDIIAEKESDIYTNFDEEKLKYNITNFDGTEFNTYIVATENYVNDKIESLNFATQGDITTAVAGLDIPTDSEINSLVDTKISTLDIPTDTEISTIAQSKVDAIPYASQSVKGFVRAYTTVENGKTVLNLWTQ